MAIKNPILFCLVVLFVAANILDSITAYFILPGEANPIYLLTGNLWLMYVFKFGVIFVMIYWYRNNLFESHFSYFMLIMILIMFTLILSMGVASNIYGILNPSVVVESANIPTGEKVKAYSLFVIIIYAIPTALSLFGFKLYEWSLKYIRLGKKYYPEHKWWQIWQM